MIKNMEQYTNNLENLVKEQTGKLEVEQQKIEQILLELLPKWNIEINFINWGQIHKILWSEKF